MTWKIAFFKLYTDFKQLRSKRPLIGSNSNCLNNGSVWALYVLIEMILMNLFWIFMNRWHSNPHAKIPYVKRDWTILQYSVRNIYSGKNLFNLLSTPENFFNLLATISIWFFQDICSFKFNPRKLKFWTLSMLMSFNIFVNRMKYNIFRFFTFNDNLFTANQLYTSARCLLRYLGIASEIWMVLNRVVSSAYNMYLKHSLEHGMSFI